MIIVQAFNLPHSSQAILSSVTFFIRGQSLPFIRTNESCWNSIAVWNIDQERSAVDIPQVLTRLSGFPNNNLMSSLSPVTVRNNDAMLKIDIRSDIWNFKHL